MPTEHLSRDLLCAVAWQEEDPARLAALALAHLEEICPRCRAEFHAFRAESLGGAEPVSSYAGAVARALVRLRGQAERIEAAEGEAARLLREIRASPPKEWPAQVEVALEHHDGPVLARSLLEEGRGRLPGRPREAYALAHLAKTVLHHAPPSEVAIELYARSLAHMGNARRSTGELAEAGDLFDHARFLLRSHETRDRRLTAELDHMEGALRRAQRRLGEAEQLLARAEMAYELEERPVEAAQVQLALGFLHREQGDLERALAVTRKALAALDVEEAPRLYLMAHHNVACLLRDAGEYEEARCLLLESLPLYERYPDAWTQLRRVWLEGNIARGFGEEQVAERCYRAAREGFLREGLAYDGALVSLDLAMLYLGQRRTGEVKALAEEMVEVFEAQGVHREALAALLLWRDAARAERLTLAFLRDLAAYLEAARHNPQLAFRASP